LVSWPFDGDRRNYRVSFAKIRNRLGFTPRWTLEQGIQQVIEAIRSGKIGDYRESKYSNVKFLSEEGLVRFMRRDSNWAYNLVAQTSAVDTQRGEVGGVLAADRAEMPPTPHEARVPRAAEAPP
jgi:hypothetical protein